MDMAKEIDLLQQEIVQHRKEIVEHKVYRNIETIEDLKIFMEHHVFAVWDFMSLLKALQKELTCVETPWLPKHSGALRYLINEIVIGEESDEGFNGQRQSHYEMYLSAMQKCGASTNSITSFVDALINGSDITTAFEKSKAFPAVQSFVNYTMHVVNSNKPHVTAAVFTFGREDLIPDMFLSITRDISKDFPEEMAEFKYYLERHIELDGDEHGHMALEMTEKLCGTDKKKWEEAKEAVKTCLAKRKELWDEVDQAINQLKIKTKKEKKV